MMRDTKTCSWGNNVIDATPLLSCSSVSSGWKADSSFSRHRYSTEARPKCRDLRVCSSTLCSISAQTWERLYGVAGEATLLSQFTRAVNIMVADHLIALVLPKIGNGPFHAVVDVLPSTALPHLLPLSWDAEQFWLGPWRVQFQNKPAFWNPRVAWEEFSIDAEAYRDLSAFVTVAAQSRDAWQNGVILGGAAGKRQAPPLTALGDAGRSGDADAFVAAAALLAGWGPGLTPSGDDFLAGLMLSFWAQKGEAARPLCDRIAAAALPRTTRLSGAFLRAAANGLADARWHALLHALTGAPGVMLEQATREVLAFGATSGLDMLAGFLHGILNADVELLAA